MKNSRKEVDVEYKVRDEKQDSSDEKEEGVVE